MAGSNERAQEPAALPPIPPEARSRWALFLDVDGTLVEIAPTPADVVVAPRLVAVLGRLHRELGAALALVSGRSIATLDQMFAPLVLSAAGNHGLERRAPDGRIYRPHVARDALEAVRTDFIQFAAAHSGTIVEDKELSIALHFRLAPACAEAAQELALAIARRLGGGFRVQLGKMLVELRPPGGDKGSVVEAFMVEPPFADRLPVFIGDDVTDEDGFAAVNRLGGVSIRVGGEGPTEARFRIPSVPLLLDWLELLATGVESAAG